MRNIIICKNCKKIEEEAANKKKRRLTKREKGLCQEAWCDGYETGLRVQMTYHLKSKDWLLIEKFTLEMEQI